MTNIRPSKSRRGQARILEVVVAAVIIFIVFSGATFMIQSSNVNAVQEKGDMDRLGYNILSQIVENKVLENTIESSNPNVNPNVELTAFLQRSLPSSTYFKLTISEYIPSTASPGQWGQFDSPTVTATNTLDQSVFTNSLEVSSTQMLYTSDNGNIYSLVLRLARAGGVG